MRCPFCAHEDSQVKDSRPAEDGSAIRRRRQCDGCGARFTTFERVQLREVTVIKSDGKGQSFNRSKLEQSITLACRKRGIEQERIDQLVSGIQRQLETSGDSEVPAAYIRFASVYRDFGDPKDFEEFAGSVRDAAQPD